MRSLHVSAQSEAVPGSQPLVDFIPGTHLLDLKYEDAVGGSPLFHSEYLGHSFKMTHLCKFFI